MKLHDPEPHGGDGKNIFYCTYADSGIILNTGNKNYRVANNHLSFENKDNQTISIAIVAVPAIGLCPVDIYLNPNGTATNDHRRHVGHKIDHIL